ncbi:MAG: hypothetical protein HC905_11445 [Bacteroidales bacterium]|nr:hypothetical protein [Bacteroidales bacterium]
MNLKNLKTRTKLIYSFSLVLVLVIGISILGIHSLWDLNEKHNDLGVIKSTEADLLTTRLNMRTFVHLRDTQYFGVAIASVNNAITSIDNLKDLLTIEENIELAQQYLKLLTEYKALMLENKDANVRQINSLDRRLVISEDIKSDFEATGLPENHKLNFYFNNARLNGTYIYANNKPELIDEANRYIDMALAEAENMRLSEISGLLAGYKETMNDFMLAYNQSKATEAKLVEKGREIVKIADHIEENITEFIKDQYRGSLLFIIICTILSVLVSVLITFLLTKYLVSMINKGVALAQTYAGGNLAFKVPDEDLAVKDELGDLARSMVNMGEKMKEIIADVLISAQGVASASGQISSTSQQISQGASEQASSVEEVSSSMEEMASNIEQNTDNAKQTETISLSASQGINQVAQKAQKAVEANRIISEKISIINDIAFQTNILALNAAVEAARAGDHGKGFAVVASEVRKLAEKSKTAADEIVSLSKTSLSLAEEAGVKMMEIIPEIERTSKLVREIAASSVEQNNGADQINNALQQLNNVTQQNAAASEELATNAEEMTAQAEMLREKVSYFKTGEEHAAMFKTSSGNNKASLLAGHKKSNRRRKSPMVKKV